MAIKINLQEIEKANTFKDKLVDENGKEYPISITFDDLKEVIAKTNTDGPIAGNAYLTEKLGVGLTLDNETLKEIVQLAMVYFFSTPR